MVDARDLRLPTRDEMQRYAEDAGIGKLSDEELEGYLRIVHDVLGGYAMLDSLDDPLLPVFYDRDVGRAPKPEENPLGAWTWLVRIDGAPDGPLSGMRVAVKDNVCIAGVPMGGGSALLADYVPEVDATAASRLLNAGATIVGKTACEDLCFSGGSHTAVTGLVLNPHDRTRMSGGSSSGAAVAVATGEADLAVGTDQGGSVRIPAAWCGIVGLKPTFGLVPYTGILPTEPTIDHCGPLARTVREVALALDALAGADGFDERQGALQQPEASYASALDSQDAPLRVGLLEEGFGWEGVSDAAVDEVVRDAARERFTGDGFHVGKASAPLHRVASDLMNAIWSEGAMDTLLDGIGMRPRGTGYHLASLVDAYAEGFRSRADLLAPPVKNVAIAGRHVHRLARGHYYAKAQNLRRNLRDDYDRALREFDVIAMPTVPYPAVPFPPEDAPPDVVVRAGYHTHNTCPANLTGHPAISVPAGDVDGLPVGMMLVARRWDEGTLLRAAAAFESRA